MTIVKVSYIENYQLEVHFSDGKVIIADFEAFLSKARNPMTTQFRDLDRFKNVAIEHGHLTWEDGEMDISAESIYKGEFSTQLQRV